MGPVLLKARRQELLLVHPSRGLVNLLTRRE